MRKRDEKEKEGMGEKKESEKLIDKE